MRSLEPDDLAQIRAAAEWFLRVFDNLDWESFRASWSSEPTVFFPFDDTPERVTGQAAVEARFRRFFDEVRARTSGPPYLHIKPRELRVEHYGDAGLVTFMLGQPPVLGEPPGRVVRRTLLFIRENETWKLAHLHASAAGQP
jgi:ketosteroid isomerase-like protein